ncbi:MAG: hypothetical protein H7A35_01905 [Planctomycetales bacterium]|nr:hypothetical protein [bacterium]UNM08813.1 MAG: hypothetical protein H7A35_01905 [Planctomycetales bacterium]
MHEGEVLLFLTLILTSSITFYKVYFRNSEISLRRAERESQERIILEKLEILRSAIDAGYNEEDLGRLDSRLMRLIGRERFSGMETALEEGGDLAYDLQRVIRRHRRREAEI